jgi:hypothetical protein
MQDGAEMGVGWQSTGRGLAARDGRSMAEDWARGGAVPDSYLERSLAAVSFVLFSLYRYFMSGYLDNAQLVREGFSVKSSFTV